MTNITLLDFMWCFLLHIICARLHIAKFIIRET